MIKTLLPIAALAFVAATPASAQSSQIHGQWMSIGGALRVAPCANPSTDCVTVTSGSRAATSMSDIVGQIVVRDLAPSGPGVWRGRYIADGKNLPTVITLRDANHADFKVCLVSWIPFSCQTQQVTRIGTTR